jgi:DNA-binding GntR family transcriptional regulator
MPARSTPPPPTKPAPALSALLMPKNGLMMAVEQALLRGDGAHASPPIAEQIAARLAGVIALNLLQPGQRLFEVEISELLHVSRSPVREAIRILERDRMVALSARRGATVTAPDARELQDIFEVRTALYSILLEQVMQDRPTDLDALFSEFLPRLQQASTESPEAYAVQSFLFNLAIADLCSNRLVVDQLKAISLRTLRYVRLGLASSPEALTRSLKGWRAFHAAVVKRDVPQIIEMSTKRIGSIRDLSVAAIRQSQPAANNSRARG